MTLISIYAGVISLEAALMLPNGFGALLVGVPIFRSTRARHGSYLEVIYGEFLKDGTDPKVADDFAVVGKYLSDRPVLPLARCARSRLFRDWAEGRVDFVEILDE